MGVTGREEVTDDTLSPWDKGQFYNLKASFSDKLMVRLIRIGC